MTHPHETFSETGYLAPFVDFKLSSSVCRCMLYAFFSGPVGCIFVLVSQGTSGLLDIAEKFVSLVDRDLGLYRLWRKNPVLR